LKVAKIIEHELARRLALAGKAARTNNVVGAFGAVNIAAGDHERLEIGGRRYSVELDLEFGRQPFVVIVKQSDPGRARVTDADVASFGATGGSRKSKATDAVVDKTSKSIGGVSSLLAIDYDDDFDLAQGLLKSAADGAEKECGSAASGNHDTYKRIGNDHKWA
jgi:hypothetical protein